MPFNTPRPAIVPIALRKTLVEMRCGVFSPDGRLFWNSPVCGFSEDLRGYRYLEMVFRDDEGALRAWFLDECESAYSVRITTPWNGKSRVINFHKIRLGENWLVVGAAGAKTKPEDNLTQSQLFLPFEALTGG